MADFKVPVQGGGTRTLTVADAAGLAAAPANALMVNWPAEWASFHAPAVNTQATISKAAGGAGVRHVCTGIYAAVRGGTTAPAAIQGTVHLRDGAAGAGTPLLSLTTVLAAAVGAKDEINLNGLNIMGSANTAMTLEFAAAGGVNTFEVVALRGYSVS